MRATSIKAVKVSLLVVIVASSSAVVLAESKLAFQLIDRLGYSVRCERLFYEVKSNFHEVRGLTPPQTSKLHVVNLRWVEENWGGVYHDPQLKVEEDIYKALMMIPEDLSLIDVRKQQTLRILAAASSGEIYVVEEYFNPLDRVEGSKVMAHELTHIVQGNYFPDRNPSSYDASKAWAALIEGDASLTADMYAEKFRISHGYTTSGASQSMPSPLVELWLFPYRYGSSFVSHLHTVGGWNLVDEAYYRLPNTTEQIMHPMKYLNGEGFRSLASPTPREEYNIVRTDRLGEHFIRVFLSAHLDFKESEMASSGWDGDNFTYYRVGGESMFTWSIAWDTRKDQQEFHDAVGSLMSAVEATSQEHETWRIGWRYIRLKEDEDNITYLVISSNNLLSPPQEEYRPISSEGLHSSGVISQGVQVILYGGGTHRGGSPPFPTLYQTPLPEKVRCTLNLT